MCQPRGVEKVPQSTYLDVFPYNTAVIWIVGMAQDGNIKHPFSSITSPDFFVNRCFVNVLLEKQLFLIFSVIIIIICFYFFKARDPEN